MELRKLLLLLAAALLALACSAAAQDADADGCKDSPLITRMPGSTIHSCDNKEYDQLTVTVGLNKEDSSNIDKVLEGELHTWDYGTRDGVSEIQVFRNFETALKQGGFQIVYESSPGMVVARKGNTWYKLDNSGSYYLQYIVTVKEMQQEVTADASSLKDALDSTGHIAVYGIHFDTGKATIQPDSETTLNEIVKLLQENSDLKLRVEGHTDNVGAAAANQSLSEKRAQAVVAWVVAHGVAASRLTASGYGATKPVADNSSDDGRAKNRRVELVKA
jgi:OmpA-OmpF porin, OOP family